ncbi:nuclear transport factor 2 family protein [Paracoccus luteus]|uniref:nuclear transport factor 2 family protein n=1 Tax=Paracoccus luteus TaxID=2508543 RepID=UPI00106F4676|nr:nuclear transport factor 2 family protein [Paracoccus luteus]
MSLTEERWAEEESLWTMGAAEAWRNAHPACVMAFADGIVQGRAILARLDTGPRWKMIAMTDRHATEGEDCIVLAYRALATRPDGSTRAAICTSTWVRQRDGWQLIQHQQTPPAGERDGAGQPRAE